MKRRRSPGQARNDPQQASGPGPSAGAAPDQQATRPEQVSHHLPPHLAAQLHDPAARPAIDAHLSALLHTITTYLPRRLVRSLLADPLPGQVRWEQVQGTLLFADLSGFTTLSASLSRYGLAGAEQMVAIVNAIFTTMLGIIEKEDGDLLVFGGDAMLVLFSDEGHALAALRAARAMQQAMGLFAYIETEAGPFPLSLHIGVNSGEFLAASLGRPHAMQYALLGRDVEETARGEALAGPGEVVVGAATARAVPLATSWHPLEEPWLRLDPGPPLPPSGRKRRPLTIPAHTDAVSALDTLVPYLPAGLLERLIPYPAEPTVEADLKPVAVLFANLLGTTALLERSGPERWEEAVQLLQSYIAPLQEAVERYGGTLNKIDLSPQGVKLLVLFGAPTKHEDDPERAVHAALEMQAAIEARERRSGSWGSEAGGSSAEPPTPDFRLRIGLHTGDVFAGNVGSSWRKEYTVMGTPVNLAARLMAATEPGQVWATAALYNSIGTGCQAEGPREIQVKGADAPLCVYQVRGLQKTSRAGRPSPLIGRQEEIAAMLTALDEAGRGSGRLLTVVGEAGVGKSRIVEEVMVAAQERGFRVLAGHTPSYGERIPYAPWAEVLRASIGLTAAMSAEEQAARLQRHLAALSPDLEPWAPVVAEALGLSLTETPLTAGLAPKLRRQRFFDLALQLLQSAAAEQSLLAVLEDLHWAGSLTSDLLTYLGRNVAHSSVLILSTSRPVAASSPWEGLPYHQIVHLQPLSPERSRDLVAMLTDCTDLDSALANLIWERAQGNPLFVEEIVQVLQEQSVLARQDGQLRLQGDLQRARERIPPTIQGVILTRIDHLPEAIRRVLRVAAVIDPEFLFAALVAIFPHREPEAVLRERLEQLCQIGMLAPSGPDTYAFHHALTREVAYQSIPYARRQSLHEQVGRFYEQHFADHLEQYYGFLAHHYRHSADQTKAVEYALKAGRQAAHSYANEAAATYFEQTLEIGSKHAGVLSPEERIQVLRERGDVLLEASRFAEALASYRDALQEGRAFLADSGSAELYRLCSYVHERCGRYDESLDALQEAHRILLREPEGPAGLEMARVRAAMSTVYWRMGSYENATNFGQEALGIAQGMPPGRERSSLLGQIYLSQGNVALTIGQYQDAQRYFEQGLRFYEQAGQLPEIAIASNNLGYLWHLQDDYRRAIENYRRCLEAARQIGSPYIAAYAANNLGSAWYELGDYDLATEYCQESLTVRERIGDRAGLASCWDTIGLIQLARGQHTQALEMQQRSLALKHDLGDTFAEANSYINLARTRLAQHESLEAVVLSEKALEILQQLDTQALLAEAHAIAAEALLALRRVEEAVQHTEAAVRAAQATGGRKDEAVAARALAEARAADPAADPVDTAHLFQQSITTLATLGCRLEQAYSCHAYGSFLNNRGQDGQEYLEQARRLLEEIGVPWKDPVDT